VFHKAFIYAFMITEGHYMAVIAYIYA